MRVEQVGDGHLHTSGRRCGAVHERQVSVLVETGWALEARLHMQAVEPSLIGITRVCDTLGRRMFRGCDTQQVFSSFSERTDDKSGESHTNNQRGEANLECRPTTTVSYLVSPVSAPLHVVAAKPCRRVGVNDKQRDRRRTPREERSALSILWTRPA